MEMTRVKLEVYVDLDPTPGEFHSVDSARNTVGSLLSRLIGQYNPIVSVGKTDTIDPDCTCGEHIKYEHVQDMLDEGEVPFFGARVVRAYDQEGASVTHTHIEGEVNPDMLVGSLEILKYQVLKDNF